MSSTLWPNFSGMAAPRGMSEMLVDAAGDIDKQTNGKLEFYVAPLGIGGSGPITKIRHNCYLKIVKTGYCFFLFRVTTNVAAPFPATAATPEGDEYPNLKNEQELRDAIGAILKRERTKEVVLFLLNVA